MLSIQNQLCYTLVGKNLAPSACHLVAKLYNIICILPIVTFVCTNLPFIALSGVHSSIYICVSLAAGGVGGIVALLAAGEVEGVGMSFAWGWS